MATTPPGGVRHRMPWMRPVVEVRYPLIAVCVTLYVIAGVDGSWATGGDWTLLTRGARLLTSRQGLHAYADLPGLQAGPLGLLLVQLVAAFPWHLGAPVARLLLAAEFPLIIWLAERTAVALRPSVDPWATKAAALVVGLVVAPLWGDFAGSSLHLDDGLAMLAAVAALRLVAQDRALAAGLAVGVAAASKPWAVGALGLLVGLRPPRRLRALVVAAAVPAGCWLPLAVVDPRNLTTAAAHAFPVSADAPLRALGVLGAQAPPWLRPMQLVAVVVASVVVARRRDWALAFGAALVARLLFECSTLSYYSAGTITALAVAELVSQALPWRTCLAWLTLQVAPYAFPATAAGVVRVMVLTALLVELVVRRDKPRDLRPFVVPEVGRTLARR